MRFDQCETQTTTSQSQRKARPNQTGTCNNHVKQGNLPLNYNNNVKAHIIMTIRRACEQYRSFLDTLPLQLRE